jgi:hypothetical protein
MLIIVRFFVSFEIKIIEYSLEIKNEYNSVKKVEFSTCNKINLDGKSEIIFFIFKKLSE